MDLATLDHTKTEKLGPMEFREYFLDFGVKLTKNHGFPLIYKGNAVGKLDLFWYRNSKWCNDDRTKWAVEFTL